MNKISLPYYGFIAVFIACVFSGFATNFIRLGDYGTGTILMDTTISLSLALLLINSRYNLKLGKSDCIYLLILFIFSGLLVLLCADGVNSVSERLLGLRNFLLYPMCVAFYTVINTQYKWVRSLISLRVVTFILCMFAVCQFVFRNYLPTTLLTLLDDPILGFSDSNIVRVNGLIGNPIIFTGFSVLTCIISYCFWLSKKSAINLIVFAISMAAAFLSFSRAIWVFLVLAIPLAYLLFHRMKLIRAFNVLLYVVVLSAVGAVYLYINSDSFIVARLSGTERFTAGSNQVHATQAALATMRIADDPIFGIGMGSQGTSSDGRDVIITDGWLFQTALELGLPITCLFLFLNVFPLFYAFKVLRLSSDSKARSVAVTFIVLSLYYILTAFVNSAYVAKVNLIMYWMLAALVMSSYKIHIGFPKGSEEGNELAI